MLMTHLPKDASEQFDTDGDGIGNNADSDDDGDNYHDQTEVNSETDPLNNADYPYAGGRIGLGVVSDYIGRDRAFYDLVVKRHVGSRGPVSIDYRTVDGGAAVAGEHFEMVAGTLTWVDGDAEPKVVQVPLLGEPGDTRATYDFGVVLENLQGNAMYDATMGRVVLHDDAINPEWSGNIVPAYRTVAVEGDEHEIRLDRIGGSKGSLTVTVGYRPEFWGENPHVEPFTTTATWSDGEVGSKVVTVSIKDDEGTYGGYGRQGRRYHQVYLEVLDIQSEDGFAQMFGQPWVGLGETGSSQILSVLVIDNENCSPYECPVYVNSGYGYSVDYDADPISYIYRRDGGDTDLQAFIYDSYGTEVELYWDAHDVSVREVVMTPDRTDPDGWTTYLYGDFGFDNLTRFQRRSVFNEQLASSDSDGDEIPDLIDKDSDNDTIPDYRDDDADGDGLSNAEEILYNRGNWLDADSDDDGVGDAEDQMPYDADEIYDFDGDGIGDNADDDDDNDGTPDAVENDSGTDPFDAGSFPGSGGLISARSEVVVNVDRNDGQGRVIEVRVNRLLSGNGEVSVDYTTVDGPLPSAVSTTKAWPAHWSGPTVI